MLTFSKKPQSHQSHCVEESADRETWIGVDSLKDGEWNLLCFCPCEGRPSLKKCPVADSFMGFFPSLVTLPKKWVKSHCLRSCWRWGSQHVCPSSTCEWLCVKKEQSNLLKASHKFWRNVWNSFPEAPWLINSHWPQSLFIRVGWNGVFSYCWLFLFQTWTDTLAVEHCIILSVTVPSSGSVQITLYCTL